MLRPATAYAASCLVKVSKDVVKRLGHKAWVCKKFIESFFFVFPLSLVDIKTETGKVFAAQQVFILNIGKPHYKKKGALGSKRSLENTSARKQDATTLN